jgi:hypothetical protein
MVNSLLRFTVLLLLIGVAPGQAPSTRPKTIMIGTVTDTNNAVIAGARIIARDEAGHDYSTTTTDKGNYMLELPVGIYKIEANAEGFCPRRVSEVKPATEFVDFVLKVPDEKHGCKQKSMLEKPTRELSPRIAE